jgi:hypothetical protein
VAADAFGLLFQAHTRDGGVHIKTALLTTTRCRKTISAATSSEKPPIKQAFPKRRSHIR